MILIAHSGNLIASSDPTKPKPGFAQNQKMVPSKAKSVDEITNPLKLQSIFKVGNKYRAIINGKTYKKGDFVKGYELKKVTGSQVILENGGQHLALSLFTSKNKLKIETNE